MIEGVIPKGDVPKGLLGITSKFQTDRRDYDTDKNGCISVKEFQAMYYTTAGTELYLALLRKELTPEQAVKYLADASVERCADVLYLISGVDASECAGPLFNELAKQNPEKAGSILVEITSFAKKYGNEHLTNTINSLTGGCEPPVIESLLSRLPSDVRALLENVSPKVQK